MVNAGILVEYPAFIVDDYVRPLFGRYVRLFCAVKLVREAMYVLVHLFEIYCHTALGELPHDKLRTFKSERHRGDARAMFEGIFLGLGMCQRYGGDGQDHVGIEHRLRDQLGGSSPLSFRGFISM